MTGKTALYTELPAGLPESCLGRVALPGEDLMRNAAVRSNLLVPEVREVMDIRQASDYLGISPDTPFPPSNSGIVGASSAHVSTSGWTGNRRCKPPKSIPIRKSQYAQRCNSLRQHHSSAIYESQMVIAFSGMRKRIVVHTCIKP